MRVGAGVGPDEEQRASDHAEEKHRNHHAHDDAGQWLCLAGIVLWSHLVRGRVGARVGVDARVRVRVRGTVTVRVVRESPGSAARKRTRPHRPVRTGC